jgi:hypothetical protein
VYATPCVITYCACSCVWQIAAREAAVVKLGMERDACVARELDRETTIDKLVEEYTKVCDRLFDRLFNI